MELTKVIKAIVDELEPVDVDGLYDYMLNEVYGEINVGVTLLASKLLSECDPVAYRCGFNDWIDSEISDNRLTEKIDGKYYDYDEAHAIIERIKYEENDTEDK